MRALVIIIVFVSAVYALNIFSGTNNFEDYKKSIRSQQICNPHGPMYPSCSKTDKDLLNDYIKSHYGPLFIAFITPALYFLYQKVSKL